MQFGHFDDDSREYVITTPLTPYPWINYLGTEEFFSLISHTGGGYCFCRDARFRRLLRYRYNNIPIDAGGRSWFIRDGDDVWCPTWMPMKSELDTFECRHGLGATTIRGSRNGVSAELFYLVPLGETAEVCRLTLKNESDAPKALKVFSFVEFCLWNAWDDQTNFQRNLSTGEVEIDGSAIYHVTEYRERRNHYAVFGVNVPIAGFDTDREAFLGLYNGLHEPEAVLEGAPRNSIASGWAPIGSHCLEVELVPGESRDFVFVLGYVENHTDDKWEEPGVVNKEPARALMSRFSHTDQVEAAVAGLRGYWSSLLDTYTLQSPDDRLNRMVNTWNPYQCMVTFNMSRSASFFESGIGRGMGFRDSNQDLLGFVHQVPDRAKQRIIDIASTQFADGSAYHQYQPLTKRGNHDIGGGFNDDPLWLIIGTAAYIKETGDFDILSADVPFDNDESNSASLFEHLRRSFHFTLDNLGPHGLPLIGRADWNDCLNLNCFSENPDEPYQTTSNREGRTAESVFIAGQFVYTVPDYADLAEYMGFAEEAEAARQHAAQMEAAILEHAWDGEWFLRAYDFFGHKVGSRECEDGQIFIEPQGFCVMAGIGLEDGKAEQALDAVGDRLATRYGIVLNQPAYSRYHVELGEISSYPPGYKENAGIFCHNNPWVMIAETKLGRGDRAFDYYKRIAPAYLEEISEIHRTEPYVYSQMVAGRDAVREGEAKNSWLTGTAAWNYVAIAHHMLGIRPELDGLRVSPCIGAEIPSFAVTRKCRGATYRIRVTNSLEHDMPKLVVDGTAIAGTLVPYGPVGATIDIECAT